MLADLPDDTLVMYEDTFYGKDGRGWCFPAEAPMLYCLATQDPTSKRWTWLHESADSPRGDNPLRKCIMFGRWYRTDGYTHWPGDASE